MTEPAAILSPALRVDVSADGLRLSVTAPDGTPSIKVTELRAALEAARIPLSQAVNLRIAELTQSDGLIAYAAPLEIVAGTAAVDDIPAHIELPKSAADSATEAVDYYARSSLRTVAPDEVIGVAVAYAKGRDGMNVHGRQIPRRAEIPAKVSLGKNVVLGADGKALVAKCAGMVHIGGLKVWVEPQMAVPHDVDFSTGHLKFAGDIVIHRNVLDLFKVEATGAVEVGGVVEAATVTAGLQLLVHGGIAGKEKGICKSGGDLAAKFISNAHIEAEGAVTVRREINNARIICMRTLTVEGGPIMGGHVTAREGVVCQSLGSSSGVRTVIEVAIDDGMRGFAQTQLPQLEAEQKVIMRVRQEIAPLLDNAKKLTAAQKEKITEMLFDADEREKRQAALLATWRDRFAALAHCREAAVQVRECAYPGVVLRIGDLETTIETEMAGPVKFMQRRLTEGWRIAAINPLTGSVTALSCRPFVDEEMDKAQKYLRHATAAAAQPGAVAEKPEPRP